MQDTSYQQQHAQPTGQRQTQPHTIYGNRYQQRYGQPSNQPQVIAIGIHGDTYTHQHVQPSTQRQTARITVPNDHHGPRALQHTGQHGPTLIAGHHDHHVARGTRSTSQFEVHNNHTTAQNPRTTIQTRPDSPTMPRELTQQSGPFPVLPRHGVPSPAQQTSPTVHEAKDVYPLGYYQPSTSQADVEPLRHAASQPNVRQPSSSNREPQRITPPSSQLRVGTSYAFHYPSRGVGQQMQGRSRASGPGQGASSMVIDEGYTSWLVGQGGSPCTPAEYYDVQTNPFDQEEVSPTIPRDYTPTSPSPLRQELRLSRTRSASTLARGTMTTGGVNDAERTRTRAVTTAGPRPTTSRPSRVEAQYQRSALDAGLGAENPGGSEDEVDRGLPQFIAPSRATRQRYVHAGGNARLEDREEIVDFNLPRALHTSPPPELPSWVPAPHPNAYLEDSDVTPVTVTAAGRAASMRNSQAMVGTMTTGTSDPTAGWALPLSLSPPPVIGTPIADEFTSSSSLRSETSVPSLGRAETRPRPGTESSSGNHGSTTRSPREDRRNTWDRFAENGWGVPTSEQEEQAPAHETLVQHGLDMSTRQPSLEGTRGKRARKPSSSTSLTFRQRIKRVFFRKPSVSDDLTGARRRSDRDKADHG